jgi:hypothetical protein
LVAPLSSRAQQKLIGNQSQTSHPRAALLGE